MPKQVEYTPESKDQAVRLVAAEREPNDSRSAASARLGPRLGVETPTLYSWVKQAIPRSEVAAVPGSVEELRAANAALRKENRELARANDILQAAASSSGRSSTADRRSSRVHRGASHALHTGVAVGVRADLQSAGDLSIDGPVCDRATDVCSAPRR